MSEKKEIKTIQVSYDQWAKLMDIKIRKKKKSLSDVIEDLLKAYEKCGE